jgi:transposase-like protein
MSRVELAKEVRSPKVCKKLGIRQQTYYRWRNDYYGMRTDPAKRLKELERVNPLDRAALWKKIFIK